MPDAQTPPEIIDGKAVRSLVEAHAIRVRDNPRRTWGVGGVGASWRRRARGRCATGAPAALMAKPQLRRCLRA